EKINVGLLGYGFIGSIHQEVMDELEKFSLLCVAEPKNELTTKLNVPMYPDYQDLIDNEYRNLDAVVIALPTGLHREATKYAFNFGLDVLLEKPMAVNSKEAKDIRKEAILHDSKLMVGMTGRYHPEFLSAYNAIKSGIIGNLISLDEKMHYGSVDFPEKYLEKKFFGGGIGLTNGIHTVDRFLWFADQEAASVDLEYIGNDFFKKDIEDNLRGNLVFDNGIKGTFSLRWSRNPEQEYVFEAAGTKGKVIVYGFDKTILSLDDKETVLFEHEKGTDFISRHKLGIKAELLSFAQYLHSGKGNNHILDCINAQKITDYFEECFS
ncbi:MAG: Gfo/Idh/MocA family oxidoreductase, partial [Candidatus Aenigmarchaeota archaeon]|nr:Gfo/Idh/MocA family oxidoreductase [Candidatus Aenigmarchaeota archaeon]